MSKDKPKFLESVPKGSKMYLLYPHELIEVTYQGYSVRTRKESWCEWPTVGCVEYTERDFVVKFKNDKGKKIELTCNSNDNLLSNDPRDKWDNNEHYVRSNDIYFTSDVNLLSAYIKDDKCIEKVEQHIKNLKDDIKRLEKFTDKLKAY